MENYLDLFKQQFNNRIRLQERRPSVYQVFCPFFHEDGDMVDVFIEKVGNNGDILISDHGMTVQRLSYSYDIDTSNKERIFKRIVSESGLKVNDGRLCLETQAGTLYQGFLQFVQGVTRVSNMGLFKREVIQDLFYEMFSEWVVEHLASYAPRPNVFPIQDRDDLEVDYEIQLSKEPIYIFGVKDNHKARLTTISCLEFQKANLPFTSVAVHEDFEALSKNDRKRITSACDKQFVDLSDFKAHADEYLRRKVA